MKKRVERDRDDPRYVITTYDGVHNHPLSPYAAAMASAVLASSSSSSRDAAGTAATAAALRTRCDAAPRLAFPISVLPPAPQRYSSSGAVTIACPPPPTAASSHGNLVPMGNIMQKAVGDPNFRAAVIAAVASYVGEQCGGRNIDIFTLPPPC